ncbi:pin2-interacting x1 [Fusarium sporotrichioides]|uniref:PinX1-related protein 1 n=1 Tax=Fusarium sporotrichioides TaxID=5514 RepID=A0A395RXG8_FUSSP|nr:pin2-interacting x1 [Fusarium sporotrichioides]
MGLLAENKTRRKINKDPNNTKWTKDTNTFGQKILRAQGWQPGQFLGAQDAPHSELHTAANASYIRVVLKDDMKGLGFSKSKEDEVTGLDVFQDLLSRLNGKAEEAIEEDQQNRLAVKTHHFVEQRYGAMRFVYGGLLIGDEMKEAEDKAAEKKKAETSSEEDVVMESVPAPKESKKEKKSKKRKVSSDDDEEEESSSRDTDSKSKKRRKEERRRKETDGDETKAKKKEKKEKKDKSRKKSSAEASDDEDATPSEERSKKRKSKDKSRSPDGSDEERVKDKKSKKEKKEKKKRKKEEESASAADSTPGASVPGTGVTTPSGTSTPRGSRNFVRSRFIAQKRQAVLDTKALNQIFMVKA